MDSPDISPLDPDVMDDLPSVPRIRKNSSAAPSPSLLPSAPVPTTAPSTSHSVDARGNAKAKTIERRGRVVNKRPARSPSITPPPLERPGKRRAMTRKVIDDDDDDDEEEDIVLPMPSAQRISKNTFKARSQSKSLSRSESNSFSRSQSNSQSLSPSEKSPAPSRFTSRSMSFDDVNDTPSKTDPSTPVEKEGSEVSSSKDFDTDNSGDETRSKSGSISQGPRLTKRQRALKGEKIELEYSKLESPKSKKRSSSKDEWTNGDEKDLQRQQRARMRQLITEKRNKEKRAATVDKVLRGVTSKRKKMSLANEAITNRRDSRMLNSGVPKGFLRYTSGQKGTLVAVHPDDILPEALNTGKVVAHYPPPCTRDPTTGKRIFI